MAVSASPAPMLNVARVDLDDSLSPPDSDKEVPMTAHDHVPRAFRSLVKPDIKRPKPAF